MTHVDIVFTGSPLANNANEFVDVVDPESGQSTVMATDWRWEQRGDATRGKWILRLSPTTETRSAIRELV